MIGQHGMRIALLSVLASGLITAYGYWHATTHGWLYVSLYDTSETDAHGRVLDGSLHFLDAFGSVLAEGKTDPIHGVVHLAHPDAGYCSEKEQNASYSAQSRAAWKACFATLSGWLPTWADDIRYLDITTGNCRFSRTPVSMLTDRNDWWLWWVPHPHVGGMPYTSYHLNLRMDLSTCEVLDRPD